LIKKYPWHFFLTSLSLYIFTIWKCIAYNRFCRDGIYFKETTDTASFASFLDLYFEFDDSGQISTKIYDFNFKNHKFSKHVQQYTSVLSFTSFWRNSDSYEYENKSARRGAQFVPIGMLTTCWCDLDVIEWTLFVFQVSWSRIFIVCKLLFYRAT
jgi:hypothetical protein